MHQEHSYRGIWAHVTVLNFALLLTKSRTIKIVSRSHTTTFSLLTFLRHIYRPYK